MVLLFRYKCQKGHITKREFPRGTRVEDEDETTCLICLDDLDVKPAWVISVEGVKDVVIKT
jgi:hypothetical protein